MPLELIPILALIAMFVAATLLPINMGTLGFVAAFLVGTIAVGMDTDDIIAGFPSDLFLTLVGVTYLFAIAQNNGTVDLMVRGALQLVRGRVALIPWVMFGITGVLTALGALGPAAVAIIAPIALTFARQYKINALLMGMMVIHGAQAGGFSPISIYGVTVNNIAEKAGLVNSPLTLFLGSLFFNLGIGVLLFAFLGGRSLLGRTIHDGRDHEPDDAPDPATGASPNGSRTGTSPAGGSTGGSPVFSGHGTSASASTLVAPPNSPTSSLPRHSVSFRSSPYVDRPRRSRPVLVDPRPRYRLRVDDGGGGACTGIAQGAKGRGFPDQLVDRAAHRRSAHLCRGAAGSRQRGVGRQWRREHRNAVAGRAAAVLPRRDRVGVRVIGGHPRGDDPAWPCHCYSPAKSAQWASSWHSPSRPPSSTSVPSRPMARWCWPTPRVSIANVFYKQILKYSCVVVAIGPLIAWAVLVLPGWL